MFTLVYNVNTATGLKYQSPPTCPANHVPRVELLKEISSAILNSDITPTIGTTVTIRGIGGIGKSTIAKALCHDPLIKEHFINGFLWISLTPPLPNPMTMLSEIYQRLTGKSATINSSILKSEIKFLVSNHKLLVILDDVWEAKDAMMFVDVFSSCKTVMTTRKMDINVKIPPIKNFDVKSMSVDEATQLLTLQIIEVETLHATNVVRIQKLAKDLHCWPLLLNLVHGQLYVHCNEWNESPQDAILKVQQKLSDNGLTAFDPENQLEASRENAVRASITASLELLSKNEEMTLIYIASSMLGFGVYTISDVLSNVLQMDSKNFNKYTNSLWCQGLISYQDITFSNVATKIPCITTHEVIAQYINENMPDQFYLSVTDRSVDLFTTGFLDDYFTIDDVNNFGLYYLNKLDAVVIPFYIRFLIFYARKIQVKFYEKMNELVEKNIQLLNNDQFKNFFHNPQFPSLKHMHKIIKQDCESIHQLLVDGKYSESMTWIKRYFDNHPCKITLKIIITNLNTLLELSRSDFNDKITLRIKGSISYFNAGCGVLDEGQKIITLDVIKYNNIMCLLNAGASDSDVKHFLNSFS